MEQQSYYFIDGNGLFYRSFFAIPRHFRTADGTPTNAVYGFTMVLRQLRNKYKVECAVVVFDPPGGSFRDKVYEEYKANRPPMPDDLKVQLPWIKTVAQTLGFRTLEIPGYEADDVIATLTQKAEEQGRQSIIVSSDKDFCQLVTPLTTILDPAKEKLMTHKEVQDKYSVSASQFIDYLALVGDSSDNIPGVPGVGPKTAVKILAEYPSVEAIKASADKIEGRVGNLIRDNLDSMEVSFELAKMKRDVPLSEDCLDCGVKPYSIEESNKLFQNLEFNSLLEGAVDPTEEGSPWSVGSQAESLDTLISWLESSHEPVFLEPIFVSEVWNAPLIGCAIAREQESFWVPAEWLNQEQLLAWWGNAEYPKSVHDVQRLLHVSKRLKVNASGFIGDTQLLGFLVNPTRTKPHTLDKLARQYLHQVIPTEESLLGKGKSKKSWLNFEDEDLIAYSTVRAQAIGRLYEQLKSELESQNLWDFYLTVFRPMADILVAIQETGVAVNKKDLEALKSHFVTVLSELEEEIVRLTGHEFNVASPKQVGVVLFEELGLTPGKKTKTGYSTSSDILQSIIHEHPIVELILAHRKYAKLLSSSVEVLLRSVDAKTERIHCHISQVTAATGRLNATNPDLQTTPVKTEEGRKIRDCFQASEGCVMVAADWSQIELRVLAHFSQDPYLLGAFNEGVDIHTQTAMKLFGLSDPSMVGRQERTVAKTVNFATIYGQGAYSLSQNLGISQKEAKHYIESYFQIFKGVKEWSHDVVLEAKDLGYVETLLGRRRYLPDLNSRNAMARKESERIAVNTPIQGSAADICYLAMLQLNQAMNKAQLKSKLVLQIHDELLFEVPSDEVDTLTPIIQESMEQIPGLEVPLVVDIGIGHTWAEAH